MSSTTLADSIFGTTGSEFGSGDIGEWLALR